MRPLIASIRLENLRHNYLLAKQMAGGPTLAVIKANAYGHGALRCAQALADVADGFAVACLEEAVQLREGGVSLPIVLLEGVFEPRDLELCSRLKLWHAVHCEQQIDWLAMH